MFKEDCNAFKTKWKEESTSFPQASNDLESTNAHSVERRGATPAECIVESQCSAGLPGNTPALNRQIDKKQLLSGGLDTLEVRMNGCWEPRRWESVCNELEQARIQAEATRKTITITTPEGENLVVASHGIKRGDGFYSWLLEWEGMRIIIKNQPTYNEKYPNIVVEIGSIPLMDHGHKEAWSMLVRMLSTLGFRQGDTHVSRVDLCVDLPEVGVQEFVEPFMKDWCLRRGRSWGMYGDGLFKDSTGYWVGGDIHIRIYDKIAELKKTGDVFKQGVLMARRWGYLPEQATRVEFQVRREALKNQFRVDSVEDLFKRIPDMIAWLTFDWFRLTDGEPDRENGNERRSEVSPLWQRVIDLFTEWAGRMQLLVHPRERSKPSAQRLAQQALGVLTSLGALCGSPARTVEHLLEDVRNDLFHVLMKGGKLVSELVGTKREKFRARVGSTCISIDPADIPF